MVGYDINNKVVEGMPLCMVVTNSYLCRVDPRFSSSILLIS